VLGKISGPERVRVPVKWRILCKEKLYDLYFSPIERKGKGEERGKYGGEEKYIQDTGRET